MPIAAPNPQVLDRRLWTMGEAPLRVRWKEPGHGASRFKVNVDLTGSVA